MHTTLTASPASRRLPARGVAGLLVVALIGLTFVIREALPYFKFTDVQFGRYLPHRTWLIVHITAGIIALLSGPVQLWLGLSEGGVRAHRLQVREDRQLILTASHALILGDSRAAGCAQPSVLSGR